MRSVAWALAALTLAACGGSGTKPEDMTVEEHQAAVASDEKAARLHDHLRLHRRDDAVDSFALAKLYASHAAEHGAAAKQLDAQHAAACEGLAAELQGECPLMHYRVSDVERLADGVRVTFRGAEAGALLRHAECHRAHGASEGREEMPACPLYSKGLNLRAEPSEGGAALFFTSAEAATVERVQSMYEPARP